MNHILNVLGITNVSGRWYGFWSGFGGDLGYLAIIGGMIAVVRRHNCEVHRCWRVGRHDTVAGHSVCRRHHPDGRLTAETVSQAAGQQQATAAVHAEQQAAMLGKLDQIRTLNEQQMGQLGAISAATASQPAAPPVTGTGDPAVATAPPSPPGKAAAPPRRRARPGTG